jgi:hypothetical protein
MIGVTWKGSDLVSDSRNAKQSIDFDRDQFLPASVLGLRTYGGFYFFFSYASAFSRWPAPGVGSLA